MTQLPTLYALADVMNLAVALLSEAETPEELDAAIAEIERSENDLALKAERCVGLMREFEARAAIRKQEADRYAELARLDKAKAERLKKYVKDCLEAAHLPSIETNRFRIRVQNSPAAVDITDETHIPGSFLVQRWDIDKSAIKKWIEEHGADSVPGARIVRGTHLRVS